MDRAVLRSLVFADAAARGISRRSFTRLFTVRSSPACGRSKLLGHEAVVVAVPLLFETGRSADYDRVVVTACNPELQLARLVARGLTVDAARQRMAAQLPTEEKVGASECHNLDRRLVRRDGPAGGRGSGNDSNQRLGSRLDLDLARVLRRRDPFLDERVPVVAVRALPEQLGAAIAAAHADVRIEVEDRVLGQLAVAIDERRRMVKLAERAPDRLVDAERVRVLDQRGEQQVERLAAAGRSAARWRDRASRARQSCGLSSIRRRHRRVNRSGCRLADRERFEPVEREVGAIGRDLAPAFPRSPRRRCSLPCGHAHVAEVEVGRHRARVEIDRALEAARSLPA